MKMYRMSTSGWEESKKIWFDIGHEGLVGFWWAELGKRREGVGTAGREGIEAAKLTAALTEGLGELMGGKV